NNAASIEVGVSRAISSSESLKNLCKSSLSTSIIFLAAATTSSVWATSRQPSCSLPLSSYFGDFARRLEGISVLLCVFLILQFGSGTDREENPTAHDSSASNSMSLQTKGVIVTQIMGRDRETD